MSRGDRGQIRATRRGGSWRGGGPGRIRTSEGDAGRFTVCSLWPLGHRPRTEHASAPATVVTTREPRRPGGRGAASVAAVPYPNFAGKHEHEALTEPAAFVRYWVAQGR